LSVPELVADVLSVLALLVAVAAALKSYRSGARR